MIAAAPADGKHISFAMRASKVITRMVGENGEDNQRTYYSGDLLLISTILIMMVFLLLN